MADDVKVHMGEGSPEHIAMRLYHDVMNVEKEPKKDRKYLLDLYAECIEATKGNRTLRKDR